MPLIRVDQARINVGFPGGGPKVSLPFVRSWAQLEGGDLDTEDTKTRPGGMLQQVTLGGPSTRSDATVLRQYSNALHPYIVNLENVAGQQAMQISYQIWNSVTKAFDGPVVTIHGVLKTVTRPNFDANTQGAAFLSLVMSCQAQASVSQ